MLAGAQTFKIAADPYAIISKMKAGYKTEAEACSLLRNFKEEGNPMIETSDDPQPHVGWLNCCQWNLCVQLPWK